VIRSDLDEVNYVETGAQAVENREALYRKYRSVLHPKHAFLTTLRCSLSQLYGRAEGYTLEDLPDILLERKIEICKDILSVADIIEPGLSRLRGRSYWIYYYCSSMAHTFAKRLMKLKVLIQKRCDTIYTKFCKGKVGTIHAESLVQICVKTVIRL